MAIMIAAIGYNHLSLSAVFMLIALLGAAEFTSLMNKKIDFGKNQFLLIGLQAFVCVVVFSGLINLFNFFWTTVLFICVSVIGSAILFLSGKSNDQRLALVASFFFSLIYVVLPFLLLSLIGYERSGVGMNYTVLYFFVLVWTNDTMAYVSGRLIGKHKLAESISPKKTIEGFVGGLVFTTIISVVLKYSFEIELGNPIIFVIAPLVVGIFSTIGDLFESALKRWIGVKDSGKIIPGHGGILDRFDGAIVAVWPYAVLVFVLNR